MKHCLKIILCLTLCSFCFAKEDLITAPFGNTQIVSVFAKPGDFVKRGQLIARLDTNEIKTKLGQLKADKQQIENEIKMTHKLMKKTKARRNQRMQDKQQAQIDANQIISGLNNLSSLKNKTVNNQQIESDIKSLAASHQKQRQLSKKLHEALDSLTASELKFESLIEAADIKSPFDGMILDMKKTSQKIERPQQTIGTIDHA